MEVLLRHRRVGLDSSVFFYHLEPNEPWSALAWTTLRVLADGQFMGVTSVLTLMEMAVKPLKLGRLAVANEYELLVRSIPNLDVVDLDAQASRFAAGLRAYHGVCTPDALQIGAAFAHGATAFVTNDKRLRRFSEIDIVILDDFIKS